MTIAELYHYAVSLGIENLPMIVTYECSDDWYGFEEPLEVKNIEVDNETVIVNFS